MGESTTETERRQGRRSAALACGLLLLAAAAQYGWNAFTVAPLAGYDAGGHAAYMLTIIEEGRLPPPYAGWSTFHPPLYYLLGAGIWRILEPLGPRTVIAGLRGVSALAILTAGLVAFVLAGRLGYRPLIAWVSAALVLFVPVAQMAAAMIGNESLATGFAALALPAILALQVDPRRAQSAILAGLLAGLALATKYTGIFVTIACVVPFVRGDFDRRVARALMLCGLVGGAVALPTYVRNVRLTGSPIPVARTHEPMKSIEESYVLGPRRVADYLTFPAGCLLRPSIVQVSEAPPRGDRWNRAMQSVWGLTYASCWYDAFTQRVPLRFHRDGVVTGPLLTLLGLVPTAVMLFGFAGALIACMRRRGRSPDAPLVVMALAGLVTFVAITWGAPAMVAVKCSYMLPLSVPAAVFFARGATRLPRWPRRLALALSLAAAAAAALVFTTGLVLPADQPFRFIRGWEIAARALPGAHIEEAARRLTVFP
jgi:4-amino-4-deoxy-L-arabinose transferase-like glycosyltransferase